MVVNPGFNKIKINHFFGPIIFIVVVLFLPTLLAAQVCAPEPGPPKSRIDRLRGGILGMEIQWSGGLFSGLGSRADAMGGSISTLFPDAESISANPAGIGFARGFHFTLDWAPPMRIDPGAILGLEDRINDSLIESSINSNPPVDSMGFAHPELVVDEATVNSELDMRGGLKGGAFLYGNPLFGVAVSFNQPFRIETQLNVSGMEFLAAALDDDGDVTSTIFGTINGNLNLAANIETSSIGVGARIFPNLAVGMVYDNFNAEMNFASTFLPEGIISKGEDIRAFNDPARIQYDSLFARVKGNWEGSSFRFRWGVGYRITPNMSLDATLALPFKIDLRGLFSMVHNNIRALNLDPDCGDEAFNVDTLVVDNLTKTQRRETSVPGLDIEIPGQFAVGFSTKWHHYVASAVYIKYLDNLSYRFSYTQVISGRPQSKRGDRYEGIALGSAFRLGIGVEPLMVGVGAVLAETFQEKNTNTQGVTPDISERKTILLPFFTLGGGVKFGPRFRLDYVLNLYESSFLRFSTSYRL